MRHLFIFLSTLLYPLSHFKPNIMDKISQYPDDFNPLTQLLNFTSAQGSTEITFQDMDLYLHNIVKNAIIFGVRIGAASVASIILFLISKKRKTPVFILNQTCLLLTIIHSALYIVYLFTGFGTLGFQFTGFLDIISQYDINVYAATNLFQLFLTIAIEASLIFQVHTIFQGPDVKWLARYMVSLSLFVGLAVIGLSFYVTIQSVIKMFNLTAYTSKALDVQPILFASSINLMSVMLVYKLITAIRSRRYLGLKQFDGFHILLIMSTQTLVIPSILVIISYAVDSLSKIAFFSIATLIIVLSLPLSSMWATSATDTSTPSSGYNMSMTYGKGTSYLSDPATASTKVGDLTSHKTGVDHQGTIYTPSTAEEEEAKRYWMAADDDDEDDDLDEEPDFFSRTTHRINK